MIPNLTSLRNLKNLVFFLVLSSALISCTDDGGEIVVTPKFFEGGKGFFVINEGTFGAGNGSISFYSDVQEKMYNEVYRAKNEHLLGDTPLDMIIFGDTAAISVNVSGNIEFVILNTMRSVGFVAGIPSPRQMTTYKSRLLVSDISLGKIFLIDKSSFQSLGTINTGKAVEHMVVDGDNLYAACWSNFYVNKPNNTVLKIDLNNNTVVDSLIVTKEPNSMVIDANGALWVLCSGGYMNEEAPALYRIDLQSFSILNQYDFIQGTDYPSGLCSDGSNLYFLNNGSVWKMENTASALPSASWYTGGSYLYNLGVEADGSRVVLCDAKDFQSNGEILVLDANANLLLSLEAGLVPSGVCFNAE